MAQQLTIRQIAELAGVSVGTVDRVLHNRGRVSPEALAAVQAVLDKQSYKYNLTLPRWLSAGRASLS